jgi:hypothetical protein
MSRRFVGAVICVLALVAACSLALGQTVSAYTASVTTASNTFTEAANSTPGVPLGVALTAGDGQIAVNWNAPSSAGSSSITSYTAEASPSGASCTSTSATACTITGLTDGDTQSVTVTASNAVGAGPASAAQSATPYPASLFSGANGLSLWLDAADASTLFSSASCSGVVNAGASVGCWTDKGATAENFTQATAGSQPVLGSLNGLGAIDFTSTAQVLNSINGSDTYQTVFIATQPQTTPTGWDQFFGQTGQDFDVRTTSGGGQFSAPNNNDWASGTGTPPLDWSNGRQGVDPTLGSTSILTAQASGPKTFSASVSNTFYSRGMLGNVGEVIAFSGTLTTAQRRTVEDYLAHKWGVTITPDPPGTPTATAGTAGTSAAAVSWNAPAYDGGSAVTGYTVTSNPGAQTCTTTGATSCTVTGLTSGTAYTFTATATNSVGTSANSPASNQITPVTAPVTSAAAVGRSSAYDTGFIKQGATYYVYANVSDTGNPSSAIARVTANVSSITAGSTAVALTAGSFSAGGTTYGYRSAVLTAASSLAAGSHSYTITATDNAASVATQSFTTSVDNTAPTAVDVQSTNVSGGTVGHLDQGDTLALTYSDTMDPYSILPGWTGAATNVQVALVDGGSASDYIVVYNTASSPAQIPLGTIYLGATGYLKSGPTYVTYGATGSATLSTIKRTGSTITITLGTPSGATTTNTTAARMTWTPSTAATDIAGNATSSTTATQSGTPHANF